MEEELQIPKNDGLEDLDDDDAPPMLSSHALAALKEFLEEQNKSQLNGDEQSADTVGGETGEKVTLVAEDWRLSQFWYDPLTAETIAKEVIALLGNNSNSSSRAACIACPTLYAYIKKIEPNDSVQLLEYDKRFEQYGSDFTFYDYNQPEDLPSELKQGFQVVVADPPYLSKECLEKVAQTISLLARHGKSHFLLLTGLFRNPLRWAKTFVVSSSVLMQWSFKVSSNFKGQWCMEETWCFFIGQELAYLLIYQPMELVSFSW